MILSFDFKKVLHLIALRKEFYKNYPSLIQDKLFHPSNQWIHRENYYNIYCLVCNYKFSHTFDTVKTIDKHGLLHIEKYKNLIPFI